jgi:hypothetical protein
VNPSSLVINGGQFYGDINSVLLFLDIFFHFYNPNSNSESIIDQSIFNYLIYSGLLKRNGLDFVIDEKNNSIACLVLWPKFSQKNPQVWGEILSESNKTLALGIHYFWGTRQLSEL